MQSMKVSTRGASAFFVFETDIWLIIDESMISLEQTQPQRACTMKQVRSLTGIYQTIESSQGVVNCTQRKISSSP